jgi:hypothetical protein
MEKTVKTDDLKRVMDSKIVLRSFQVRANTFDKKTNSIEAVLSTENPVRIYDWESGQYINEVLLSDGFEFAEQIPLLDSHARWSIKDQLGSIRNIRVENNQLVGRVIFGSKADAKETASMVEEGHTTDLSIGYVTAQSVIVQEGQTYTHSDGRKFQGPVKLSLKTIVKEGSVTPIGADEMAKFRSDSGADKMGLLETENRQLKEENNSLKKTIRSLATI